MRNLFVILLLLLLAQNSWAETFNVSTTPELRDALKAAATNGEDDTIIIADGTYKTTDDDEGVFIYLSKEDNELTLKGMSSEDVVLSGDGKDKILNHATTLDTLLKIEGISFIDAVSDDNGGAIFASHSIEITNSKFQNNKSNKNGGAIYSERTVSGSAAETPIVTVNNSIFISNQAQYGGAIWGRNVDIKNSEFSNNHATYDGGAILGYSGSRIMKIVDSTFSYNSADATGGGLWVRAYSSSLYGSGAIIRGSEFFNNTANIGAGFYSGSVLFLEDSTLDSNIATNRGGGFATSLGGTVNTNVQHSSFINNQAGECGGGFSSRGVKLVNSILVQNTAPYGGAFCAQYAVLILNSLVIDNSSGIDVYSDYDFNIIVNSIFEGNNNQDFTRATASSANQIVTFKNNFINLDNVESLYFEDNNIFKDIVLGFVDSANGNYQLTQGSHLIDSGSQDCVKEPPEYGSTLYCNIGPITGPIGQTDLNGSARLFGAYIDIGPYEYADSDGDGIGNYQDTDDDNDGVIDAADAYPLIAIGDLADVDKDGVPDACDEACLALGMTADTDNDNDGVEDSLDAFPLNAEEQVDTDGDGVGDNYEILNGLNINDKDSDADGLRDDKEVALGTNPLSSDSDLDGVIDGKDKFPLVSLGELEDSDGDGAPDECDDTCLASGMTADRDGIPPYILLDQPTPEFANLVSTAKIIVTSSDGENFFDVARYVDEVSVVGQTFLISGSSDIDGFMVMPGVKYDLTNLKGSVDKLYMSGPLEEYADSILLDEDTGMMQLSRLTDIGHEVVQFIATNVASDLVIFTDGAISTALIKEAILDGSSLLELTLDTTLSTLDAKAATGAQVKHIVLDSDGAGVMGLGPKITQLISGSSGVDKIYVPAGSVVDASNLKASQDEVYLEGDLDDYTLNYNSSGNIVLSRDVLIDDETFTESVTVANGGNVATNDLIIFADQQVTSEALKLQIN